MQDRIENYQEYGCNTAIRGETQYPTLVRDENIPVIRMKISSNAKVIYFFFEEFFKKNSHPSVSMSLSELEYGTSIGRKPIIRALSSLEENKILKITKNKSERNLYELVKNELYTGQCQIDTDQCQIDTITPNPYPDMREYESNLHEFNPEEIIKTKTKNISIKRRLSNACRDVEDVKSVVVPFDFCDRSAFKDIEEREFPGLEQRHGRPLIQAVITKLESTYKDHSKIKTSAISLLVNSLNNPHFDLTTKEEKIIEIKNVKKENRDTSVKKELEIQNKQKQESDQKEDDLYQEIAREQPELIASETKFLKQQRQGAFEKKPLMFAAVLAERVLTKYKAYQVTG